MNPVIEPVTILGVVFPETENYAVELASSREALIDFDDLGAAPGGLDAAAGLEAAARKFFLFVLAVAVITAPLIYYTIPKKMAWLKYTLLGVLMIAISTIGYVWWVTYQDMMLFAEATADADEAAALDAEAEAAALDAEADADAEII